MLTTCPARRVRLWRFQRKSARPLCDDMTRRTDLRSKLLAGANVADFVGPRGWTHSNRQCDCAKFRRRPVRRAEDSVLLFM